jgi:TrmH family RNA methyltransferase
MQRVSSRSNPRLKEAVRLASSSRDRRKAGRCVLEGEHLVGVHLDRIGAPETLIVLDERIGEPGVRAIVARVPPSSVLVVPRALFAEIASLPADVGMLAVVPTPRPAANSDDDFCVLLEDVQDPGNLGTILRTAAAAGVQQAILSPACAFAWSPKVLRAGQGAHFQLAIREGVDLVAWSGDYALRNGTVAALVADGGEPLFGARLSGRLAIAIGNEGAGLSAALVESAGLALTIPMPGGSESLNAAAAAAIALFERVRQRAGTVAAASS